MAVIGAAVNSDIKQAFEAIARSRLTTSSRLASTLIVDFINAGADGSPQAPAPARLPALSYRPAHGGARTKQVHVRLEPFYHDELGRLAVERHWDRGSYLANLLHAHIDRRPVLCHDEVNAVRQVARQLADIGRNINQIARQLNISHEDAHVAMAFDFELLRMLLDVETQAVKNLVRANLDTWGVEDAC